MKLTPAKVTMLMLVAVGGLIGLYIVKGLFAVEKKPVRPAVVTIPLAAGHLTPGTKIGENHIGMGPFPQKELKSDMLRTNRMIVGRVVMTEIKPGEPIRATQLYPTGENAPLQVADGKQAIAIPVKATSDMVDGLIKPGEYVDVHFTLDKNTASNIDPRIARLGGVSMTLFKGVKLLALNRSFRQSPTLATNNSATLELAPEQMNVVLVTQSAGVLTLTYNPTGEGDGGVTLSNSDRATLYEVLGLKKPVTKPEPEPEKPFQTETYRGASGGVALWDRDGKRFSTDNRPNRTGRQIITPGGPGSGGAGAYGNLGSGGSNVGDDPNDFDPRDVFEDRSPSNRSPGAVPQHDADPDIPSPGPSTSRGVRSRTGSILRAIPQSTGPTALRN